MAIPQIKDPSVRYLQTAQAYDLWAQVYDTDGNFLQALDSIEMKVLLPKALALVEESRPSRPWKLVDLGCGTGRNTAALLEVANSTIVGLDVSPGMLQVAKQRLSQIVTSNPLHVEVFDLIQYPTPPNIALGADLVVSTLVIEHVPSHIYFRQVASILKPGGILLLTNMHSDMGAISQAGFVDPTTGDKIRPTSYAHTLGDITVEAEKHGLELVDEMEERCVNRDMVSKLGARSEKWVGVTVWFGGLLRRKPSGSNHD
ncbi:hypothetical protein B0A52_08941 [Exophiala mesophila]|uniref:Methyltransferase type 12 domain-containing protein n=1 Tax=Exophiala mesophila TaxID=212818 RepID=A0A438MST7_EXOME|nr:hypothetical protein B0A52_08941 [Exophiala mesophila]